MSKSIQNLCYAALIAAIYVALTHLSNFFGLASGAIQLRLSEALTILPLLTPAAIPGLAIGCFLANLTTGCLLWDIIGGTAATLLGALGTRYLSKSKWTGPIWPILANMLIVPFVLQYAYQLPGGYFYFMLTVGIGEILCCGVLGIALYQVLRKTKLFA